MKYRIVKISEANHKSLRDLSKDEGLSVSSLLNEVVREFLEESEE